MKKTSKYYKLLACLLATVFFFHSCFFVTANAEEEELFLYARSAVLLDGETGRVLYEKDGEQKMPMASTTKIMTCIVALENGNLKDPVSVSSYAASMPDVQMGIREGEQYYLEDLLYSLMLESHNDSAVAIAEHIGGSVQGFARMMNQKALDLGCDDTYFITPNGLDATDKDSGAIHTTTAKDLAAIMRYCVLYSPQKEKFLEITGTSSRTIQDINFKRSFYCGNHNALLSLMPEAVSGKTGFTGNAGYCYVGAIEKDGKTFIMALLACGWPPHKTYKWADMKVLKNYALEKYEYRDIFEKDRKIPPIPVERGVKETVQVGLTLPVEDQNLKLLMHEEEKSRVFYDIPREVKAPIQKGIEAGSVKYYIGEQQVACYPVYFLENVEERDFLWCLRETAGKYIFK